jgi:hypothetical protein
MASLTEVFNGIGLIVYPGSAFLVMQFISGDTSKSIIAGGLVALVVYSQQR